MAKEIQKSPLISLCAKLLALALGQSFISSLLHFSFGLLDFRCQMVGLETLRGPFQP